MSTTLSWDGESSRLDRAKADGPRKKTTVVLLKTQIALGVLGMPTVLLNVGAVPGVISESHRSSGYREQGWS